VWQLKVPPFDFAAQTAMIDVPQMLAVLKAVPINRGGLGAVTRSRFSAGGEVSTVLVAGGGRRGTFGTLGPPHRH
jgi:hypothetical protein